MQYRCKHCHGALNTDFRCQSCGRDNTPRLPLSGSTPFVNEWIVPDLQWKPPQEPVDAEPTLEEVLAELDKYGTTTLVTISVPDGAPGTYVCRVYSHRDTDGMFPIESGFAHSRIEAARECLRRVTE